MITTGPEIFLRNAASQPIIDVRSPLEYNQGHIPGAINIPIFSDDERKIVGTLYKNSGREAAVLSALDLVGPKLTTLVKEVKKVAVDKRVLVHCWRGGLRSKNMAWLFETSGLHSILLEGGYKAYRRYIREHLAEFNNVVVLGGKTGSGKSDILQELKKRGQQVVDLEQIAHHKGSAFGHIGQEEQPTNEQFENNLYHDLAQKNKDKPIWVEDESRGIGKIGIPEPFFHIIRTSPVVFLEVSLEIRVKRLVREYGRLEPDKLISAIHRIAKKLGGLQVSRAISSIHENQLDLATEILLSYYDKAYLKGLFIRQPETIHKVECNTEDPSEMADILLRYANNGTLTSKHSISN
ncbi:MAG: tRNA 2-selenouridine(34) synthase MnmH [Bacteroidales bacterium]